MVPHGTNWRIAVEQMVTHCTNRWFMVEQMFIHCTNVWSVASQRCGSNLCANVARTLKECCTFWRHAFSVVLPGVETFGGCTNRQNSCTCPLLRQKNTPKDGPERRLRVHVPQRKVRIGATRLTNASEFVGMSATLSKSCRLL